PRDDRGTRPGELRGLRLDGEAARHAPLEGPGPAARPHSCREPAPLVRDAMKPRSKAMRGHNAVSALAAILAAVALVVLSSVSHAGEQEAGALIERSRAAMAAGDKVSIRTLVRADRSAAYEAVHRLGAEGSESALRLAETIAAAYAEIYSDRRLVERMPQFRAWTPEERKARAPAVAMKAEGRAAYADGRPEDALRIMETACATFDRIHDEREGAWCAN